MKVDPSNSLHLLSTWSKDNRLDKEELYGLRERLLESWADDFLLSNPPINLIEFQHESDDDNVLTIDDLDPAPTEMEDSHPEA
ncbi:hypothetical protein L3X38_015314 [Prunus dulcis]|uniref:Uncharacterized protein n=1 Tax=Prunus dulcis TaxID=3755 RepID=A0AAD4WPW8_PRUDU|nr:hypothetical protein L3X38_015314 [Prunus dulcis]